MRLSFGTALLFAASSSLVLAARPPPTTAQNTSPTPANTQTNANTNTAANTNTQAAPTSGGGGGTTASGGGGGGGAVSISYSVGPTLIVTGGSRIPTTVSYPITIPLVNSSQPTGGTNATKPTGNITTTPTTTSTMPFAQTTSLDYGGGGTTVPAPVPGGSGPLQQGPPDSFHNSAIKMGASVVALTGVVATLLGIQLGWVL